MKVGKVTLNGNHQKIAKDIIKHRDLITRTTISVDPGSTSPAYALWMGGRLVQSEVIKTKSSHKISERLATIHDALEGLPQPDIVLVEKIGMMTGRKTQCHPYLLWSLGAIVSALRCKNIIEIPQTCWSKFVGKNYTKSDLADAEAIGGCAFEIVKSQTSL